MPTKCIICRKEARYNFKGKKAEYCKIHSSIGMTDVRSIVCKFENCLTRASYGVQGTKEFCSKHKLEGMVDLKSKRCKDENCNVIASFGFSSGKKEYCVLHKKEGMICLNVKKCNFENCKIQPSYKDFSNAKIKYCSNHKPQNAIPLYNKCLNSNCKTIACFGYFQDKKPTFCKTHKLEDMIDISNKKCEKCSKVCRYGFAGSKTRFCGIHKLEGMINLCKSKCKFKNCKINPSFTFKGNKIPEYCAKHKQDGMISIDKKCLYEDCNTRASCGYPGYSAEYCGKHKLPRMKYRPYSLPKEENKKCEYCGDTIHYNEEFCPGCKIYIQLGTTLSAKTKEIQIKALLEDEYKFFYDERVGDIKKRPDFRIPIKNGNIIIEVDEYQHKRKNYPCECELLRMKQIFYACGKPNMLFLRYNPDYYKTFDEIYFDSKRRESLLLKYIQERILKMDFSGLNVVYLFYDWFSIDSIEIEKIDII